MRQIAYITDLHLYEQFPIDNHVDPKKNFEIVLADIKKRNISDMVYGGDIGAHTSHKFFFEKLQNFSLNLILGNHDKFEYVKNYFYKGDASDELYYRFDDDNYQYIFLDTSVDELSSAQLDWLKGELDHVKDLILFVHHPILEVDTPVDKLYPLKNREELISILLGSKSKVTVFCGHYHMNDEQEHSNIKQYTTQSMSFQLTKDASEIVVDNSLFGYRIIEIYDDKINTRLINFNQ